MPDRLWKKLTTDTSALDKGWHLTRAELRSDFIEDQIGVDAFAYNNTDQIEEIRRTLITESYHPSPLVSVDVPKGPLGVRPGSRISVRDRVVFYAIISLIAEKLDDLLPKPDVYSYRLKTKPTKDSLFKETDATELPMIVLRRPFLKKQTITQKIDPFEPWYGLWPIFDEESRKALEEYPFLSVTDISAYFENISLQLLRQQLTQELGTELKIANTLMHCFEFWAVQSEDGFRPSRGIPQGSGVTSFFGNFFLLPLDNAFKEFAASNDVKYFRYMDDVRVFSKDEETARKIVFKMDQMVRSLHLNLQSAKTVILTGQAATQNLLDERVEKLKVLSDEINTAVKSKDTSSVERLKAIVHKIAKDPPRNPASERLIGSRSPLTGLSLRAFRMMVNAKRQLGDSSCLDNLFKELQRNPDPRVTKAFQNSIRNFPSRYGFGERITQYIEDAKNLYPHQEAELIKCLRYVSKTPERLVGTLIAKAESQSEYFYVRVQSAVLLTKFSLTDRQLDKLHKAFERETDEVVLTALALPLGQLSGSRNSELVDRMVFHPNSRMSLVGKHLLRLQSQESYARQLLKHVFEKRAETRICDFVGYLDFISQSHNKRILEYQLSCLDKWAIHPVLELRGHLSMIATKTQMNADKAT